MSTLHYRKIWLLLGTVYIIIIFLASLTKVPETQIELGHTDKLVHFALYFILVGWFIQLYEKNSSRLFILLFAILLGLLIEFLQGMTSYRSFDYLDEVANSIGALCAFFLAQTSFSSILQNIDAWIVVAFKES